MLEDGRGVPGDYRQAYLLYLTAGKIGLKDGPDRLEKLKKRLNAQQIQIAEAFVASGGRDSGTPPPGPAPAPSPVTNPDPPKNPTPPATPPTTPAANPKPPKTPTPKPPTPKPKPTRNPR
jgi:hypothetical protein